MVYQMTTWREHASISSLIIYILPCFLVVNSIYRRIYVYWLQVNNKMVSWLRGYKFNTDASCISTVQIPNGTNIVSCAESASACMWKSCWWLAQCHLFFLQLLASIAISVLIKSLKYLLLLDNLRKVCCIFKWIVYVSSLLLNEQMRSFQELYYNATQSSIYICNFLFLWNEFFQIEVLDVNHS